MTTGLLQKANTRPARACGDDLHDVRCGGTKTFVLVGGRKAQWMPYRPFTASARLTIIVIESLDEEALKSGLPDDVARLMGCAHDLGRARVVLEDWQITRRAQRCVTTPEGCKMTQIVIGRMQKLRVKRHQGQL